MRYHVIISCMEYVASHDCVADSEAEAIEKAKAAIGEKDWEFYGGNWSKPCVLDVDDPVYSYLNTAKDWEEGSVYKSGGYIYYSLYER